MTHKGDENDRCEAGAMQDADADSLGLSAAFKRKRDANDDSDADYGELEAPARDNAGGSLLLPVVRQTQQQGEKDWEADGGAESEETGEEFNTSESSEDDDYD